MAKTFIKLNNDYQIVSASVAVNQNDTLKDWGQDVQGVFEVSQKNMNATDVGGHGEATNWRYINTYGQSYYLIGASVIANDSNYYVTGINKMTNQNYDYILLFNKNLPTSGAVNVVLEWGRPIIHSATPAP